MSSNLTAVALLFFSFLSFLFVSRCLHCLLSLLAFAALSALTSTSASPALLFLRCLSSSSLFSPVLSVFGFRFAFLCFLLLASAPLLPPQRERKKATRSETNESKERGIWSDGVGVDVWLCLCLCGWRVCAFGVCLLAQRKVVV